MFWAVVGSLLVVNVRVVPSAQPPHAHVPVSPPLERHLTDVNVEARESPRVTVTLAR